MIRLNYKTDTYLIKNTLDEFSIEEFEIITKLLNSDENEIIKWVNVLNYLGLPYEVMDDFEVEEMVNLIEQFSMEQFDVNDFKRKVTIDGIKYTSSKTITVKQISLVEEYVEKDNTKYIGELMAIVFKEDNQTKKEHLNDKNIKAKAKLFREQITADIAIPYINLLTANIFTKYNTLND